jgi:hypothetical protein
MTRERLIEVMRNVRDLPFGDRRTIYEAGDRRGNPVGEYFIDFASYGGTSERVPRNLIDQMEQDGSLVRAFPTASHVNAWRLKAGVQ